MEGKKIKSYKKKPWILKSIRKALETNIGKKNQSNQRILKYMNNVKDQYPCPINGTKFSQKFPGYITRKKVLSQVHLKYAWA